MSATLAQTPLRPRDELSASSDRRPVDVAIVGGGLAGLTAATVAARAGRSVTLYEKASSPGGRAVTRDVDGFLFNVGPHAVYRAGTGVRVLRDLGLEPDGGVVTTDRAFALREGRLHALPAGLKTLVTTSLLGVRGKLELAHTLAGLYALDPASLDSITVEEWLAHRFSQPDLRALVATLLRVATYADAPSTMSAGAALRQFQAARDSVLYVHGGWQTIVNSLRAAALSAGARIVTGARVVGMESDTAVRAVRLADRTVQPVAAVVLAVSPAEASALVAGGEHAPLRRRAETAVPVRAATLDVGLRRLPNPAVQVVLGVDRPVYLSAHSIWARLAPAGGAVVHVMKYLGDSPRDAAGVEAELEALLDRAQPGWRDVVAVRRFLPDLTVSGALATVAESDAVGRQGPTVPGIDGLFVAGDWVTAGGMLADAALTSGDAAARAAIAAASGATVATRSTVPRDAYVG